MFFYLAPPTIVQSSNIQQHSARLRQRFTLECEASGVPPPLIIWRFNWGCLKDPKRMHVEAIPSALGCKGSKSRLIIDPFMEGDDGIYNCEALSGHNRAMSQDMFVLLST